MYSLIRDAATYLEAWELQPRTAGVAYIPESGAAASLPAIAELLRLLGQEDEEEDDYTEEPPRQPELYDPRQPDLFETDEQREQRVQHAVQPAYTEQVLNWVYESILRRWEDTGENLTEVREPSDDIVQDRVNDLVGELVSDHIDNGTNSELWDSFIESYSGSETQRDFWNDILNDIEFDNDSAELASFLKQLKEARPEVYKKYAEAITDGDEELPWNMRDESATEEVGNYGRETLSTTLAENKAEEKGFYTEEFAKKRREYAEDYNVENPSSERIWSFFVPYRTDERFFTLVENLRDTLPDVFSDYIARVLRGGGRLPIELARIADPGMAGGENETEHDWRKLREILTRSGYATDPEWKDRYDEYLWSEHSSSFESYVEEYYTSDGDLFWDEFRNEVEWIEQQFKEALPGGRTTWNALNTSLRDAAPDLPTLLEIAKVAEQYSKHGEDLANIISDVTADYQSLRAEYPYLPDLGTQEVRSLRPSREPGAIGTRSTWPEQFPDTVSYAPGSEYFNYLKKVIEKSGPIQWAPFIKANPWVKQEPFYTKLVDPKTGGRFITTESLDAAAQGDAQQYDLSYSKWNRELQNTMEDDQIVVRLDFSDEMAARVGSSAATFILSYLKYVKKEFGGHPLGPRTIGHARISVLDDGTWYVDEVQSDAVALITGEIKPEYSGNTREQAIRFFRSYPQIYEMVFGEWEYALMDAVMNQARQSGATTVKFATADILKYKGATPKSSKIKRYYQQLPRNLGFVRDEQGLQAPSGQRLPVWTREARARRSQFIRASAHRLISWAAEACDA